MFAALGIPALLTSLVQLIPGLATIIGNTIVKNNETQTKREADQNQSGVSLALGWLQSVNKSNDAKREYNTEKMLIAAFVLFTLPTGIHWWGVMLDCMPWFGHKVGSWKIAAPPGQWAATYHAIIQSFYIMAPATAGLLALARAFRR